MIIVHLWYDYGIPPKVEIHENNNSKLIGLNELSNKYISKKRYCIGYDVGGKFKPHGILLDKGYQCDECKKKDVFLPCSFCDGSKCISNSEKAISWCNQKFAVYLAYFGDKFLKVGVAALKRLKTRLIEQGAIAYKIYKIVENGLIARRIESKLKKEYIDKVRTNRKIEAYKRIDLEWAKQKNIKELLDYNYNNLNKLNKEYKIKENFWIPKIIGSLGDIIITNKGYFPFSFLKGRKIVERKNLSDWFKQ